MKKPQGGVVLWVIDAMCDLWSRTMFTAMLFSPSLPDQQLQLRSSVSERDLTLFLKGNGTSCAQVSFIFAAFMMCKPTYYSGSGHEAGCFYFLSEHFLNPKHTRVKQSSQKIWGTCYRSGPQSTCHMWCCQTALRSALQHLKQLSHLILLNWTESENMSTP